MDESVFRQSGGSYSKVGDYLLPNIIADGDAFLRNFPQKVPETKQSHFDRTIALHKSVSYE